jgi:hypothetical protein
MMNFGNCRQVVSEIVVYGFLLYMMNFGNCRQAEHSTIVFFFILQYVLYSMMQTIDNNSNNSGKDSFISFRCIHEGI